MQTAPLWQKPVSELPGVAAGRSKQLEKLAISSWFDLLGWFPKSYEDWSKTCLIADLVDGAEQVFVAEVSRPFQTSHKGRLSISRAGLKDESRSITAVWFNQPWLADKLLLGQIYRFRGLIKRQGRSFQVQNPAFEGLDLAQSQPLRPLYSLTKGLGQQMLRRLIMDVLERTSGSLPEPLPAWLRRRYQLCAVDFAYSRIHLPQNEHDISLARQRLGFEELFMLRAGLWLLRQKRLQNLQAIALKPTEASSRQLEQFLAGLPFTLTRAQVRVWQEISRDLAADRPMSRLLQGDVGSGKTVLAALAMLQCALGGAQAVMMAPTAILARQHYKTLQGLLAGSGQELALLTAATKAAERKAILAGLASGEISLLVGTHALIQDRVVFARLGLAITDEQHRFGVSQRQKLAQQTRGGEQPHTLVMSATPIPRSLALILYGDMDLSLLDEMPAGRTPVETYTAAQQDSKRVEKLMERFVSQGRQVYVVCPLIEEQAELDLNSAVSTYNHLAQVALPDLQVGLLHGGMRQAQKDQVMDEFMAGRIQVLVSTTVIEVGVDNPNAALMVIENAERFGLAQLHQLRGRIGRGPYKSLCVLKSDAKDELARRRLRAICLAKDGFAVAEEDLQLRGPGDFFGTRQHGLPELKIANLYRDVELLAQVQEALDIIAREDPDLEQPEHQRMSQLIKQRYPAVFAQAGL